MSQRMSEDCHLYRHSNYQSMIAAQALSMNQSFKIVTVPTGSGKTWIEGLIAKYYCLKSKSVTVIEPNERL